MKKSHQWKAGLNDKVFIGTVVLPALLFFAVFVYYPFFRNIYLSFMEYNYIKAPHFVGLENYRKLLTDEYFHNSLKNTFLITALSVPSVLALALFLSVMLFRLGKLQGLYRSAIFSTYLVPLVVASVIFKMLFGTEAGLVNSVLIALGGDKINWLTEPRLAMLCLILLNIWNGTGYYMVIFLAGLSNINYQLYEAADVDGAGPVRKFIDITIPSLTPTTVFAVIFATISFLRTFVTVEIMTGGGPYRSTETIIKYMFDQSFKSRNVGYSSLLSIVLFLITLAVSLIQLKATKSQED